jgi:DNA-binding transcriptional LysR family regulator
VIVRFLTDMRLFRLDYGEAHVAIRAGAAPEEPDNVVQPLVRLNRPLCRAQLCRGAWPAGVRGGLCRPPLRHRRQRGQPRAVLPLAARTGADPATLTFRASEPAATEAAVIQGRRPGLPVGLPDAGRDDLVEVLPPRPEWESALWIVTHVDLHRTRKVQAFLAHLKEAAKGWKLCS